jgi:hypothetical protein
MRSGISRVALVVTVASVLFGIGLGQAEAFMDRDYFHHLLILNTPPPAITSLQASLVPQVIVTPPHPPLVLSSWTLPPSGGSLPLQTSTDSLPLGTRPLDPSTGPSAVPEPASLWLIGSGLTAMAWWRRTQHRAS